MDRRGEQSWCVQTDVDIGGEAGSVRKTIHEVCSHDSANDVESGVENGFFLVRHGDNGYHVCMILVHLILTQTD
jgi:hypothetical protein